MFRYYTGHHSSSSASHHISAQQSSRMASSTSRAGRIASPAKESSAFREQIVQLRISDLSKPVAEAATATPLAVAYGSRTAYFKSFLPLILQEARDSIAQNRPEGRNWTDSFGVSIQTKAKQLENFWVMTLDRLIVRKEDSGPAMNVLFLRHMTKGKQDMVMLVLADENVERGTIEVKFVLSSNTVSQNEKIFEVGERWQAVYITSLVSNQRMYDACVKLPKEQEKLECIRQVISGNIPPPSAHQRAITGHTADLNASQQRAVQSFVEASKGITLLQGPPGTGKTTTIVQMLAALTSADERVLVCAPSNKAVQVLANRFVNKFRTIPSVLVGTDSKVSEDLRPIFMHTWASECRRLLSDKAVRRDVSKGNKSQLLCTLETALEDVNTAEERITLFFADQTNCYFLPLKKVLSELREATEAFDFTQVDARSLFESHSVEKLAKLARRKERILAALPPTDNDIETALLNRSKVIFATLCVAGRMHMLSYKVDNVDVLVVDEAGQSVEAETLIAFQHMPRKVLLVGDTKQLPATVLSTLAKEKNFDRSMMERLEQNNAPRLVLGTQYRMHAEICKWPSKQFYKNMLKTDKVSTHADTGLTQPIACYDISTGKERSSGTSRQNDKEAGYVLQVVRKLRETDRDSRIGVITF
jgi:Mrp family chromosome partitioning ATPase